MIQSNVSGFPRIGPRRELKFATESYWKGGLSYDQLSETAKRLRADNWRAMAAAGIDLIPSNDFSFYDHVLDTMIMVGAVPDRYGGAAAAADPATYFAMARGRQDAGLDLTAMEMTKWFDTNYHYIVPELSEKTQFSLSGDKAVGEFNEAKALGVTTVPVLVGPLTFLLVAKAADDAADDFDALSLLDRLLPVYEQLIADLGKAGAEWVQIDEPILVLDQGPEALVALQNAYERLAAVPRRPKIVVKTYFGHAGEAYPVLRNLPIEGVGLDFVYGPQNEDLIKVHGGLEDKTLFAGIVGGRNIWINDLSASLELLGRLKVQSKALVVSTSSSLLHTPVDLAAEADLDGEVRSWLAFARQKVSEVATLTKALNDGEAAIAGELDVNRKALESRRNSKRAVKPSVRDRMEALGDSDRKRPADYAHRRELQQQLLDLPPLPSTTIGSYPQTQEIRQARAKLRKGDLNEEQYEEEMRHEVERVVRFQEKVGLDVLVHGEPERNDMVQYFAEQMDGYAFTQNGWVQSYGSRCVRPPIIYGDLERPEPMTIEWIKYAQSLTDKPVKGMLTGPVTMLMWSFVRDDQPRSNTCRQLALAIRDEVQDLEKAGFRVIQVDEPALREGLPLRHEDWEDYLDWAVDSFRLSTSGVQNETQIQTHMCYADFGDIIGALDAMDADVALIEASRSNMELLEDFTNSGYEREIGPGVYDIHSPRVPSVAEMEEKLRLALKTLRPEQVWVTPDCGLKTRAWPETEAALTNMVAAAAAVRKDLKS